MIQTDYLAKPKPRPNGFALIATISVMVLLVMIALAMLSLTTIETRSARGTTHQAIAQANARLALMMAINDLQKFAGPDQRVTARADILQTSTTSVENPNWIGVWKTTQESSGIEWPIIGKAPSGSGTTPYSLPGAYEDLRHSSNNLKNGAWRDELRLAWLVSKRNGTASPQTALNLSDDGVVELIGKGTLGDSLSAAQYDESRVLVEKVDVDDRGAYAWYVADNNQKASVDPLAETDLAAAAFEAAPRFNPALVKSGGATSFANFTEDAQKHSGKLITYLTAPLTQRDRDSAQDLLGEHYNDLTSYSPGLFTDTLGGGLRHDLTPLLLSNKGDKTVDFSSSEGASTRKFSSSYPIIPGAEHGVLGPSFGALRNWAQHTYTNLKEAETSFASSATRMRPAANWPHGISDGFCADASEWAESAPKIHPVMTDVRWHYYFSHNNKRVRTHIIPRVCLWNPYNRALKIPVMTVLMPNPFYQLTHGMHFFPEEEHVQELRAQNPGSIFTKWIQKSGHVSGNVYKMRTNPFPKERYLAFSLESTSLGAGECHVFSPKVTSPDISEGNVGLQRYQPVSVSANILSSSSLQGTDHYYFDHDSSVNYQVQATKWTTLATTDLGKIDFNRLFDYQPEVSMQSAGKVESFPFALKVGSAASISALYTSNNHPTLQLVYGGAGGDHSTSFFGYDGDQWRAANQQTDGAFGPLQTFADAPLKDAPSNHQVGAKMLWLNENNTEGASAAAGSSPLRGSRWLGNHMVYNVAPVANWNVRAQLTARSPSSQCAQRWFMHSQGSWITQFQPYSPHDVNDQPSLSSGGAFAKNPFGATIDFPFNRDVVLFDLPSNDFGVLSLGKMRHAMLSPYSWSPSYVVGHSMRDMHAPSSSTAHNIAVSDSIAGFATRWDSLLGKYKGTAPLKHGAYAKESDSQGLLQIGNQGVTKSVDGVSLSSSSETLAYDIAYEVNQNLWDRYFISGMPLSNTTEAFDWVESANKKLWNTRYQYNVDSGVGLTDVEDLVATTGGLNHAFWRNAEFLKNKAAFNVNSTSVLAWTAFLSGSLGEGRPLQSGQLSDGVVSFARHTNPEDAIDTNDADPDKRGGWVGARKLSDDEVRLLAENIVVEVRKRGPFISLADFINRRLRDADDDTSHMGALDAAIKATGLNRKFYDNADYQTTNINSGGGESDNNHSTFKSAYKYGTKTVQPDTQAWGLPGFLTQGDLLEPLAPAMAVRGDTFTVRAYGESSEGGVVKARAWLEVIIERTPNYVQSKQIGSSTGEGNISTDRPLIQQHATGEYTDGDLTEANKRFGREFRIKSFRWLNSEEI
jgi:type II secretory pathway pseudopilin PulG